MTDLSCLLNSAVATVAAHWQIALIAGIAIGFGRMVVTATVLAVRSK